MERPVPVLPTAIEDRLPAGVNRRPSTPRKPNVHLFCAAGQANSADVNHVVRTGVNVRQTVNRLTPIQAAAYRGDVTSLSLLLRGGARVENHAHGPSPLYIACRYGHAGFVRRILKAGAYVDQPFEVDGSMVTPMYAAAMHGHVDCVRLLLDHGAACNWPVAKPQ